jgi:hypothetical protein
MPARKQFRKYYVETMRPPYPEQGSRFRVHSGRNFDRDQLSPDALSLFAVVALTREDAIAQVIDRSSTVVEIF